MIKLQLSPATDKNAYKYNYDLTGYLTSNIIPDPQGYS
jgi:hypothetical protein